MKYPLKGMYAFQLGVMVDDMDQAVRMHTEIHGIKRWYRTEIQEYEYYCQGERKQIKLDIVVGYCKGSQIELIEVLEGEDNAYAQIMLKDKLLHTGVIVRNFDKKYAELTVMGLEEIHHGTLHLKGFSKVRVAYFDARDMLGYVLEIIEATSFGINLGMPEIMLMAGLLTGDSARYKPRS